MATPKRPCLICLHNISITGMYFAVMKYIQKRSVRRELLSLTIGDNTHENA